MTRFRQAVLVLLALIVLPVLFYSGYQISTLSDTEELIARIHRQQLDLVLMSINQHAWDVVNGWVNRISGVAAGSRLPLGKFLERTPAVREVFWGDPGLQRWQAVPRSEGASVVVDSLRRQRDLIERLLRYESLEYRKIESLPLGEGPGRRTALVFVIGGPEKEIAGLVLDERRFVSEVLAPKIDEAAGSDFLVGVFREGERLSGQYSEGEMAQTKALWIFPRVTIGIRMRGASLDEVLRRRLWWNTGLIAGLDLLLLAGVWLVYRGMNREIELIRLRSDFVSTVSHELRTPLALIRMYAETLEMGRVEDPQRRKEYLGTILSETERLTRLVNDVLTVTRTDARSHRMAQVDLNSVVRDVIRAYEGRLSDGGFSPLLELMDPAPMVLADREAVAEAMINLLDNAMKYSEGEKYLRITTGEEGRRVFVEVEDHGKGIAPEHQKNVFEAFYRVSEGLVHSNRGTGLGLALVKRIMEAHGGEVTVRSTPGKGSTFRLLFRRASQHGQG